MRFHDQAQTFLQQLFQQIQNSKISIRDHWDIDHLCYRTDSEESYQKLKTEFSEIGTLLIESPVNGRLISTFELREPVLFENRSIDLVELPAPKKGKVTKQGFEHIEIVSDLPFAQIKNEILGCRFDEGGLAKPWNQEFEIELVNCAIKFHHLSLKSVINLEAQSKIHQAMHQSRVLEILKPYRPLVAGTFPLDLQTEKSDLDILLTCQNLAEISIFMQKNFGHFDDFNCRQMMVDKDLTVLVSFQFQGVPFELFAQAHESVRQRGYLHFQIEERLLKYGGSAFKQRVQEIRQQGFKTEPAFAQALGLAGDPYHALLQLQTQSESDLRRLFHQ